MRIACLIVWGAGFFIAIATFKSFAGLTPQKGTALWIVYLLWPLICTAVYVISQLILVFRTLEDRWPIGDIVFGAGAWAVAQILLFAFSVTICNAIKHYIDGIFFFSLCMLLSVMMVYKYWDSITVRLSTIPVCAGVRGHRIDFSNHHSAKISSSLLVRRQQRGRSRTPYLLVRIRTPTLKIVRARITVHPRASSAVSRVNSSTSRRVMDPAAATRLLAKVIRRSRFSPS